MFNKQKTENSVNSNSRSKLRVDTDSGRPNSSNIKKPFIINSGMPQESYQAEKQVNTIASLDYSSQQSNFLDNPFSRQSQKQSLQIDTNELKACNQISVAPYSATNPSIPTLGTKYSVMSGGVNGLMTTKHNERPSYLDFKSCGSSNGETLMQKEDSPKMKQKNQQKKQVSNSINFQEGMGNTTNFNRKDCVSKSIQNNELFSKEKLLMMEKQIKARESQVFNKSNNFNQFYSAQVSTNQTPQNIFNQFQQNQFVQQQQQSQNQQQQQQYNIQQSQFQQPVIPMTDLIQQRQQLQQQQQQQMQQQQYIHQQEMLCKEQSNSQNNIQQQEQGGLMFDKNTPIPNHEPTKCSIKRNGIVKAYAANTNQGLVRNYNEDRVSIILNIMKPNSRANEQWPKCSFFGVYDGHGGVKCADYLRDNLHQFVIKESSFPWNPKEALKNGFLAAEKSYLEMAQSEEQGVKDKSGSCAIVVLIVGDMCYVANVGDSRAILSADCGNKVYNLSRDHKPGDDLEQQRIISSGGKIYQTHAQGVTSGKDGQLQNQLLVGPLRVLPGRLSVSRTFGDVEAKMERYGGNPNVIISEPEIKAFRISEDHDFIVMGSDGIYDKLDSKEATQSVWDSVKDDLAPDIHQQCGKGVEYILKAALNRRTLDNITVVMISFDNFKSKVFGTQSTNKKKKNKTPLEELQNIPQVQQQLKTENNVLKGYNLEISTTNNCQQNKTQINSSTLDPEYRKSVPSYLNQQKSIHGASKRQINNENSNYMQLNQQKQEQINQQFNKLKMLDQQISEISGKMNHYYNQDRKFNVNQAIAQL